MAYTALYRKWRPAEFEDVKGQDHIVTTLKNQIKADRIGHAYLFCGTRGTGKTTVAKIFAKAVNCENPENGSPCNECSTCRTIGSGASMNVIEIDAASNNGVDNIREIRDEVAYSPTEGKYKVYIIDEVHMLSTGAFNALLKTLEEPPSYVIFILATTEAHKIPITILSRCQRYDFRRITIDIISDRLSELMKEEKVEVEERAIRYVAKAADGSMRDALSLLDQCIAFYLGKSLTYDNVLEVLGAVDTEVFSEFLDGVIRKDVTYLITGLEKLIVQGRELGQFVVDFTWYMRNLLLVKTSDNIEDVIDVSSDSLVRLKEQSDQIDTESLMRYIRIFSELSGQIKYASQKRVQIEIALVKLCKPAMEMNMDSLMDRIRSIEKQLEEGVVSVVAQTAGNVSVDMPAIRQAGVSEELAERKKINPEMLKAVPEEIKQVAMQWKSLINSAPGALDPVKAILRNSKLSMGGDNKLLVVAPDETKEGFLNALEHKKDLEEFISRKINKTVEVEFRSLESGKSFENSYVDIEKLLKEVINMEITVEEE